MTDTKRKCCCGDVDLLDAELVVADGIVHRDEPCYRLEGCIHCQRWDHLTCPRGIDCHDGPCEEETDG